MGCYTALVITLCLALSVASLTVERRTGDVVRKPGDVVRKPGDAVRKPGDAIKKPGDACDNWNVGNDWGGSTPGYEAHLVFKVDHDVNNWEVDITFDQEISSLNCWMADWDTSDHITFKLTNLAWDGDQEEGDTLDILLHVNYDNDVHELPDMIFATFDGNPICGNDQPSTPQPTQPTNPTQTTTQTTSTAQSPTTTTAGGESDCSEVFTIESEGPGTWHGLITITAETHVQGWEILATFSEELDSVESPLAEISGGGRQWTLSSKSFDDDLEVGAVLELRFEVYYSGKKPDISNLVFNGDQLCAGDTPGTTCPPGEDCSDAFTVESEEAGNWHGLITIIVPQDIVGWELVLGFDNTVDSLQSPLGVVTGSDKSWIIGSTEFDGELSEGAVLQFRFKVYYSGSNPTIIQIAFNEDSLCKMGSGTTTTTTHGDTTTTSASPTGHPGKYPYGEVLELSMLFYEAERSGPLPSDNRIDYRGDSALDDDVVGGYYDAGDHVKFGFPMASMTTILAWGGVSFYEGYEKADQLDWFDKCLKWSLDYFMAAHTADNELVGQVGNGDADHAVWGRPEDMSMNRPSYKITAGAPGSDLAGETAAALAAGSMYFTRRGDTAYAADCLGHARTLFNFADKHRGKYTDAIPQASNFYQSWSGFNDELVWAAAWLAKATGESEYAQKAEDFYNDFQNVQGRPSEFSWDDKTAGAQLLLWDVTGKNKYKSNVEEFLDYLWDVDYTPQGLIWLESSQWGSLRYAADLAHFAMQAANLGVDTINSLQFAENQVNYILGDTGRSYVCGYGNNPPQQPHHRASSCPDSPKECGWNDFNNQAPNPQVLYGALVGGPDHNDNYDDNRQNFQTNEVATDYNAGFQSALAGLTKIYQ